MGTPSERPDHRPEAPRGPDGPPEARADAGDVARPIRVLIADDDPVMRESLSEVIASNTDLELVGAGQDAAHAVKLAETSPPDVAILDVRMPKGGGLAALRGIRSVSPETRFIALSAYDDRARVTEMLTEGVHGYLTKGCPPAEILRAVRSSLQGQISLSEGAVASAVDELTRRLAGERRAAERQAGEADRVRAIIRGDEPVDLTLQAIVDLSSGRVMAQEALVGIPAATLEAAAHLNLGRDLEFEVLRRAMAWAERLPLGVRLSLNVTPDLAANQRFVADLLSGPTHRLMLEISEKARITDYPALRSALQRVRGAGAWVAVDDVGAGHASFRHVLQFAPDWIKTDAALTRGIETERAQRALTAALVAFAAEIETGIVAQDVQTEAELETLQSLGVPCGQGVLLGPPTPTPDSSPRPIPVRAVRRGAGARAG